MSGLYLVEVFIFAKKSLPKRNSADFPELRTHKRHLPLHDFRNILCVQTKIQTNSCYYNRQHICTLKTMGKSNRQCVGYESRRVKDLPMIFLRTHFCYTLQATHLCIQGLYSLWRRRLISIGIPIINLRRSSDRLRFIMGIPIPVRRRLLSE